MRGVARRLGLGRIFPHSSETSHRPGQERGRGGDTQARELETWEPGFVSILVMYCGGLRSCLAMPGLGGFRIRRCPMLSSHAHVRSQEHGERGRF